jgi:uncharacterized protein
MKYLLILLVILAVVWLLRSSARGRKQHNTARPKGAQHAQRMVECAHCGLHLPASEAVMGAEGRAYCSEAHRLAGPA